jgi:hypothetical protein
VLTGYFYVKEKVSDTYTKNIPDGTHIYKF